MQQKETAIEAQWSTPSYGFRCDPRDDFHGTLMDAFSIAGNSRQGIDVGFAPTKPLVEWNGVVYVTVPQTCFPLFSSPISCSRFFFPLCFCCEW